MLRFITFVIYYKLVNNYFWRFSEIDEIDYHDREVTVRMYTRVIGPFQKFNLNMKN